MKFLEKTSTQVTLGWGVRLWVRQVSGVAGLGESEKAHVIDGAQPLSRKTSASSQGGPGTTGHSREAKLESVRDRPATESGTATDDLLKRQQGRTESVCESKPIDEWKINLEKRLLV